MRARRPQAPCVALLLALLSGCASAPREGAFADVERRVDERLALRVHWNRGTPADEAVAQEVRELLARELTAESAVQIALLNNRELQATYEDLGVAQADLVQAGLLENPIFEAEVRFPLEGGGAGVELSLVQEFIDILQIPMRKRLAETALEAAQLRGAGAVIEHAAATRAAFYQAQAAQQALELRETVLQATEASYDLASRLREAGNITRLELAHERALHEQAKLDAAAAEVDAMEARERLSALMGVWGEATRWRAGPRLPDVPEVELADDDLEARAVEASLDLAAARSAVTLAAQRLGAAGAAEVLGEAEIGTTGEREGDGEWAVGPSIALPIPLFDTGEARADGLRAELRRARERHAALAVRVRSEARAARHRLLGARRRALYLRDVLLPLRQEIVEQTQLQYNAMQVSPLELLDAKQRQIDSAEQYVEALRDYWLARTRLEQIVTGGTTGAAGDADGESASPSPSSSTGRSGGRGGH